MNITSAALFALDAYNRAGASDELDIPFGADLVFNREVGEFAAVAYRMPATGEIVISYRGTTDLLWDGITSYPIAIGQYDWAQSQADHAFNFFNDVKALLVDEPAASWIFTGHSLGGSLAGLVASVNGHDAFVFDSMPFVQAANKLYSDVTGANSSAYSYWQTLAYPEGVGAPSFAGITSAAMENEALVALRKGTGFSFAGGLPVTTGIDSQTIAQNEIRGGTVTDGVNLHSQALVTIALHGGLQHSAMRQAGGDVVYSHLFDGALATRLGFVDSEALRQALAYSLDDVTTAALDSLFTDMDLLGEMLSSEISQSIPPSRYSGTLGKLAVVHAVHIANDYQAGAGVGLIERVHGTANIDLSTTADAIGTISDFLEFSAALPTGVVFDLGVSDVSNLAVAWSGYGGTVYLQPGGTIFFGSEYVDDIYGSDENDIIISMGSNSTYFDNIWGGGGNDVIYASAGADVIDAGSGNDRVHGGGGNDTLWGGAGADALFGDAGNDTFHVGENAADPSIDLIDGGTGDDKIISHRGIAFDFTPSVAAGILPSLPIGPFTEPTGPAFVGLSDFGSFYAQRVESLVTLASGNSVVADHVEDIILSGITTIDLSASTDDSVELNAATYRLPYLALTSVNGVSQATLSQSQGVTGSVLLKGVETWSLNGGLVGAGVMSSRITLDAAAVAGPAVSIDAIGAMDRLVLAALSSASAGLNVTLAEIGDVLTLGSISLTGIEGIDGGNGNDTLTGNSGANYLEGGAGRDVIAGLAGADQISDPDWLVLDYSASDAGVTVNRGSFTNKTFATAGGHAQGDTIVLGKSSARLDVIGSEHSDVISFGDQVFAGGGDDTIYDSKYVVGGDGYDTVHVGRYTDYIDFGAGGGELFLARNMSAYFVDMEQGIYRRTDSNGVTYNLTVLGDFTKLTGSNYADTIHGTSGNDVIYGGGGADVLHGGGGADYLEGMGTLSGGAGDDTLMLTGNGSAWGGEGNDTLRASTRWTTLDGGDGNDVLTSYSYGVWMIGGIGADTLIGSSNPSNLNKVSYQYASAGIGLTYDGYNGHGWQGEATGDVLTGVFSLYGSNYSDEFNVTLPGGYGAELRAGDGDDVILANISSSNDVYAEGGNDTITLTGTGGRAHGGAGDDILSGTGTLYGDEGADTITSSAGNHTIYLGVDSDVDTFVFSRMKGFDQVYDFTSIDQIRIGPGYKYDDFGDVMANAVQSGSHVDIWFESDTKITIMNFQKSNLTADNFLFD
jgi:Ca2+-binding RTX toxin-like protein